MTLHSNPTPEMVAAEMEEALDVVMHWVGCETPDQLFNEEPAQAREIATVVARRALRERERCAKIAEFALWQPVGTIAHIIRTLPVTLTTKEPPHADDE
jgi:hypothetical protein